jgi:hypothetical protein
MNQQKYGATSVGRPPHTLQHTKIASATSKLNVWNTENQHLQHRKHILKVIVTYYLKNEREKPSHATIVSCCLEHSNLLLKMHKTYATSQRYDSFCNINMKH